MNKSVYVAFTALACSAVLAQAPAGTTPRPSQETNPTAAGGTPAAKAETRKDTKAGAMPMASGGAGMGMMKSMDTNGDGMISKKEFDGHHTMMWKKMNPKKGMVPMADMEAMMKGGGN